MEHKLKVLFDSGMNWQFVPWRFRELMEERFDCVFLDHEHLNDAMRTWLAKWADVIFADWALDWAEFYLENFPEKRIVIRTHRGDVWTPKSPFYCWENADAVLFMDNFWRNVFVEECKKNVLDEVVERCITVPRLVDETHWRFLHDRTQVRKYGKRLGMLGRLIPRKGCLEIATLMEKELSDFSLSLMGLSENDTKFAPELVDAIRKQKGNITILDHATGDTVIKWFADVDFIISNSGDESWHAAITEGMLCGCVPMVRHWPGAEEMHPASSLFETTDELIVRLRGLFMFDKRQRKILSDSKRQWVLERYRLGDVTELYADIIEGKDVPLDLNPQEIIPSRRS